MKPLVAIALLLPLWSVATAAPQRIVDQGIAVEFDSVAAVDPAAPIDFHFAFRDTANGRLLPGLRPAAWLGLRRDGNAAPACKRQIANYLAGDLFSRADVDLNSYYVLALNDDASISVVDPLFGFGGSKLLALLPLQSPGEDWLLTPERERLFVSMPAAGKVAVADLRSWRVTDSVPTGPDPRALRQTADAVWAADADGLTRIDRHSLTTQAVRLGKALDLAVDDSGDHVAVALDDAVAIVDAHSATVLQRVVVDGRPLQLAWSDAAKAVYALDPVAGRVFVIDLRQQRIRASLDVESGASQIRFAPGGRYALLPNPQRNRLQVLDAATNTIVQNADIPDGPDQVSFTPLLAYVHRRHSEIVQMIALDQLGRVGENLNVAEFPAGENPLGAATALADSIVPAAEGPAVLVANPADKMIYLYREGMAAPAGGFRTYGRRPRAVQVVDHGLREGHGGDYSTRVPVRKPGTYDVAVFVDSPRVTACFSLTIADMAAPSVTAPRIVALDPPPNLQAGQPAQLRFALVDAKGERRRGNDLRGLAFLAPGIWQNRNPLAVADDGSVEMRFTPPQPGMYYVWIESESLGLARQHRQFLVYEAK